MPFQFRSSSTAAAAITAFSLLLSAPVSAHETTGTHQHESPHRDRAAQDAIPVRNSRAYPLKALDTPATTDMPRLKLPEITGTGKPWTGTNLNNQPGNFQFAIVTDRAGGIRPGVFDKAIGKLNLLQPEFIMSVGDLIKGYTRDQQLLEQEWDEFEGLVAGLQMPFFYVPGNHDMATPVQKMEWNRRFGPNYYHFVYGDVLFLCLDTEDAASGALSQEQVDYFRQALQENQDVRWTLLFMHRPIWVKGELLELSPNEKSDLALLKKSRWYDIEQMLQGRHYTVYAGHVHSYTKYVRHDNKYFILATTGGGSPLRGQWPYGEMDHVAWITMTDEGPIMANLLLDGILDENARTEDIAHLVRATAGRAVELGPVVTDPLPFTSSTITVRLNNPAKTPLKVTLEAPAADLKYTPETATVTVPPKTVKFQDFVVDGSKLTPEDEDELDDQVLRWTATYIVSDTVPPVEITGTSHVMFDQKRLVKPAIANTRIDGDFSEWASLWSTPQHFRQINGSKKAWGGPADASLQLAAQYDDTHIYLAARVQDDDVIAAATDDSRFKDIDNLAVFLSPHGHDKAAEDDSTTSPAKRKKADKTEEQDDSLIRLVASPSDISTTGVIQMPREQQVSAVCTPTSGGYELEMAIPVDIVEEAQGQAWKNFRVNVRINDVDTTGSKRAELWWKPDWKSPRSAPESGLFVRE